MLLAKPHRIAVACTVRLRPGGGQRPRLADLPHEVAGSQGVATVPEAGWRESPQTMQQMDQPALPITGLGVERHFFGKFGSKSSNLSIDER